MTVEDSDKSKEKAMATFAGGCFWCMEPPFDAEPGVLETIVGYPVDEFQSIGLYEIKNVPVLFAELISLNLSSVISTTSSVTEIRASSALSK